MSSQALAGLREVQDLLASFDGPSSIGRAGELEGAAEKVAACAAELVGAEASHDVQARLASAVQALEAAEKAARAHRRNPLTRPLSRARFAFQAGSGQGWLRGALEKSDGTNTRPSS
ncbi:hypothetical protein SUDANB145_06327 [Streptomyces sp. enrichment culture]|uniref:hypothetical protein n=1 Tax=Streptomyces sp. enrichment culture TaxID=1795815 RepID=UPI003F5705CE